jgi:hypothetical protein
MQPREEVAGELEPPQGASRGQTFEGVMEGVRSEWRQDNPSLRLP